MKANRKFVSGDDEAVSPVIAVILMVAITVVLAATVYVWVSGFGSQSGQASKSLSLSSAGALTDGTDDEKEYTVTAATPGMKYTDVKFTLNGAELGCDETSPTTDAFWIESGGVAIACSSATAGPDRVVAAGDIIVLHEETEALSGKTLRILDSNANSVILTLNVG